MRRRNNESENIEIEEDNGLSVTLMDNTTQEGFLQQDDYQQLMNFANVPNGCSSLLGNRELDITCEWPDSWNGFSFQTLHSWLETSKRTQVVQPICFARGDAGTLSESQRKAYNIINRHTFGTHQTEQLLMIVVGTAGTGKSFLIDSIRQLFAQRNCSHRLKITAPTGIAASNIQGCTIYSLLSLMNTDVNCERLHSLQMAMMDVTLLIIDEYSFLSVAKIDDLDRRLRVVFPRKSHVPFGGLNILLCGDPAQLPPVRAQPTYAFSGRTLHRAARFHLFNKVVELKQPFRQAGDDSTQIRFRELLARVANCEATESDWSWLQSRNPVCLSPEENEAFDDCIHVVATNEARNCINREKLSKLSPIIKIDDCDEDLAYFEEDGNEGEIYGSLDSQLFAIGAEVMVTFNLWTEAGLVNGARGTVVAILKPQSDKKARILMVNIPAYRGPSLCPGFPTVVPITQLSSRNLKGIPLTLSWAVTIHKSQGLTMTRLTVDLGEKEFSSGLTFVALSRAKSFLGLRIRPFGFDRFNRITVGRYVSARRSEFIRLRLLAEATE